MVRESMTIKKVVVYYHGNKNIVFDDTAFCLNKLTICEPPYHGHPNQTRNQGGNLGHLPPKNFQNIA